MKILDKLIFLSIVLTISSGTSFLIYYFLPFAGKRFNEEVFLILPISTLVACIFCNVISSIVNPILEKKP